MPPKLSFETPDILFMLAQGGHQPILVRSEYGL